MKKKLKKLEKKWKKNLEREIFEKWIGSHLEHSCGKK